MSESMNTDDYLIPTPLYREAIDLPTIYPVEEADTFYTPYQLFCLKSRLYPVLYNLVGPGYDIQFVTRAQIDVQRMELCVQILYNNCPAVIKEETYQALHGAVENILAKIPRHCLLFDTNIDTTYRSEILRSAWIKAVLPFLFQQLDLTTAFEKNDVPFVEALYENGYLLVQLMDPDASLLPNLLPEHSVFNMPSYDQLYDQLQIKLLTLLYNYYIQGTLVCGEDFAAQWNLERISSAVTSFNKGVDIYNKEFGIEEETGVNKELIANPLVSLYQAKWADARVGNMTLFLESRLLGFTEVKIQPFSPFINNEVQKHYIAAALLELDSEQIPSILENTILLQSQNYNSLAIALNSIYVAKQNADGFVYIKKIHNKDKITTYNLALNKYIADGETKENVSVAYYSNLDASITYSVRTDVNSQAKEIADLLTAADFKSAN